MKDAMKKPLCADYLVLVVNGKQVLQETLAEWTGMFTRHMLKISPYNTVVLHIGHQREELDGKKLTQGDSFVYLGGAVCGDGNTEGEVR